MKREDFDKISGSIPRTPGIYQFLNKSGTPIYIGKAKNLKSRLSSYFTIDQHRQFRTRMMVSHAREINWTVVESEADAFLLENTLIKRHLPRYNVMLKDGKSYSYICIKNERFPRVFFTRNIERDGSDYFGPYTSKWRANILLELIRDLFPLRTCNLNLSEENIKAGKYKICLEYQIGNCAGPCEGRETVESYDAKIAQIKNILRGNFGPVKKHLMEQIEFFAEQLNFEKAQELKEKMIAFEDYQAKSTVVNPRIENIDVFSVEIDEEFAFVNYIRVVRGAIINSHTEEVKLKVDLTEADILETFIPNLRDKFNSNAPEVLVSHQPGWVTEEVKITRPQRGDKKKLIDLSIKNIKFFKLHFYEQRAKFKKKPTHQDRILKTLQSDLNMDHLPRHIECFDNSTMQGSNTVASCVVFRNGKPAKSDYRHFNIKSIEGQDDFASMKEVVFRRYKRMINEGESLPDLIIIDGGKGQLSSAVESLRELGIKNQVTIIGIAKRLEEIYFPGDSIPVYINKKSESLRLIQHARNEAHRFAITFHRKKRSQRVHQTELTQIPGIGEKTSQKLLRAFKSVKNIRNAKSDELATIIGPALAKKVKKHFQKN
ncbi:excinuclease ABC subunit UvrC [Membranicola marinus]|uniref:UvrABC system protein C n=1 Tax=Membranihabitans marinus TaxID=1227546 RepID=A0A953HT74_9BACT|nr:excinuclease ABC subunit UvrC [Membranihabitans marinus]MBY5957895.1 excinuclease ABC subunit UvrC [Membranihabitans marinus]